MQTCSVIFTRYRPSLGCDLPAANCTIDYYHPPLISRILPVFAPITSLSLSLYFTAKRNGGSSDVPNHINKGLTSEVESGLGAAVRF